MTGSTDIDRLIHEVSRMRRRLSLDGAAALRLRVGRASYELWTENGAIYAAMGLPDEIPIALIPSFVAPGERARHRAAIARVRRLFARPAGRSLASVTVCAGAVVLARRRPHGGISCGIRWRRAPVFMMPEEQTAARMLRGFALTLPPKQARLIAASPDLQAQLSAHERLALAETQMAIGAPGLAAVLGASSQERLYLTRQDGHAFLTRERFGTKDLAGWFSLVEGNNTASPPDPSA